MYHNIHMAVRRGRGRGGGVVFEFRVTVSCRRLCRTLCVFGKGLCFEMVDTLVALKVRVLRACVH